MPSVFQGLPIFYLSPNSSLPNSTVIYPTATSILRHLLSNRYFKLIMPKPDFWAALQNLLRLFLPSSQLMKLHPSRWPGPNPNRTLWSLPPFCLYSCNGLLSLFCPCPPCSTLSRTARVTFSKHATCVTPSRKTLPRFLISVRVKVKYLKGLDYFPKVPQGNSASWVSCFSAHLARSGTNFALDHFFKNVWRASSFAK